MVFPASQAKIFTDQTTATTASSQVQIEISLCEQKIRFGTGQGLYLLAYDAKIIGNPNGAPQDVNVLTANQQSFYNLLVNAGYVVGRDISTGRWSINWSPIGPETLVNVYSFRTIVVPGAIHVQTATAIEFFFASQTPVIHSVVVAINNIDETAFGATSSVFYEYTVVVDQEYNVTDYSAALKGHMTSQGLGYNSGNCQVYKLI